MFKLTRDVCERRDSAASRARLARVSRLMAAALLAGSAAAGLAACDSSKPLPPPPDLSKGSFRDKVSRFSSATMIKICRGLNAVADGGRLASMSDAQIANGTCMMSVLAVTTISRRADPDQVCVQAARNMIGEFKTRFPDHDPNETIGRC